MNRQSRYQRAMAMLQEELRLLMTVQASDRAWQMPLAASLASGLPLLIGAWFDHLAWGLVGSLGGLVFLYLPGTPLYHRMISVMVCSFGMVACYTLGVLSHFVPAIMMPVLVFTSILVTMICRFYGLGPPGSLFFIMAASIGAYSPVSGPQLPTMVGLIAMGAVLACLIAFIYSVYMLRRRPPVAVPSLPEPNFDFVVFESVVIGLFVGISLAAAQVLQLEKAYWVPVSCVAVIQGATLRAVWSRQLQRVLGTAIGMLTAWGVLLLPLDKWSICLLMMALTFIIESTVIRHYGFAVVFITPLTILLAEAAVLGQGLDAGALVAARFFDTVLGCAIGLAGAVCLHNKLFRGWGIALLRRLLPWAPQSR